MPSSIVILPGGKVHVRLKLTGTAPNLGFRVEESRLRAEDKVYWAEPA